MLRSRTSRCNPACRSCASRYHSTSPRARHSVRCLLTSETRRALWAQLQKGEKPQQAREEIGLKVDSPVEEAAG